MIVLERSVGDPKRRYKPLTPDRRVVFGVCDGCLTSPTLQVFWLAITTIESYRNYKRLIIIIIITIKY